MVTRTSSRQAASKAKEAITSTSTSEAIGKATTGKRKVVGEKASEPRKEKKQDHEPDGLGVDAGKAVSDGEPKTVPGTSGEVEKPPEPKHAVVEKNIDGAPAAEPKEANQPRKAPGSPCPVDKPPKRESNVESGVRKSEEREEHVSSNILEKGIIYFFFRPRVNVEDPHGMGDVSRSFFVLRPTPLGAELDKDQGPVDKDARCRLMMLPKKKYPTSGNERDMGFVEKSGQTMKELQDNFLVGRSYETSTRGERHVEEARPYAEGVYAITSTRRASHLAYVLTIPAELGDIQESFGLQERGSWIVQSKNPAHTGPSYAQLPKEPEYPEEVKAKFKGLRWVPLEPEFIDYPNAQFLMIGEAQGSLGKAATAEGGKQPHEEEPGQELEKLEEENEHRVGALEGDQTIYEDLGFHAKKYAALQSTWNE